jgi:hypothetical protein
MKKRVIVGTVLSLLVAGAAPAFAQSQPFRGLFGGPGAAPDAPRQVDFTTSLFGVYDRNPPRLLTRNPGRGTNEPAFRHSDLRTGLFFTRRGTRSRFAASGATAAQHYPQLQDTIRWSQTGTMGWSLLGQRNALRVQQTVSYNPFYHFRAVPVTSGATAELDQAAVPESVFAVAGRASYRFNTAFNWAYRPTLRSTFGLGYQRQEINFVEGVGGGWTAQEARVSWNRPLTRSVAAVVGYRHQRRDFEGERLPLVRHGLDVGVNYSRSVQSPQTTFTFSTGTEFISLPRQVGPSDYAQTNYMRFVGNAALDHRLGAAWRVGVAYDRGLQYVEGISDVFFADRLMGSLEGYLGRRVDVRVTTDYSSGGLRLSTRQRGYDTQANTARLRIAVSRSLAAQVEYLYYRYLFPDTLVLPAGAPSRDYRHSVRVGLTTWFPLLP